MPKIEVYESTLHELMGRRMSRDELESYMVRAKAELDDIDEAEGILKIELNDTNRPDLWSTAGLARQLRIGLSGDIPSYDFFSTPEEPRDHGGRTVEVDPGLKDIRPYVTAFAFTGKPIDEPMLKDLIQTQEKLCWNFGQKRKSIAMGVYRTDLIEYPVKYVAADPDATRFVPLQSDRELSLREILREHPKGREFGEIVESFPRYPFLTDARGEVLSFPPIINSNTLGTVEVADTNLFIELTGTDLKPLLLTASIVACDLADAGYTILPVKTVYPYDTELGREIVSPFYFQQPIRATRSAINKMLGEELSIEDSSLYASAMGLRNETDGESITVRVPEYRNDFLHPVDVIEDIMIGRGTNEFEPVLPSDFTPGRLSDAEVFSRKVKDVMIGLGFQEMIYNYLGSKRDYVDRMGIAADGLVHILNPMSENYEYVRNSVLPALLNTEAVSAHAVYPHHIFEIGKVAHIDPSANYGSVTRNTLGFLSADREIGFNEVMATVSALFYYIVCDYELGEIRDDRYIPGRCAGVLVRGEVVGTIGEIHPQVLENWGIQMPCIAGEVDLDLVRG